MAYVGQLFGWCGVDAVFQNDRLFDVTARIVVVCWGQSVRNHLRVRLYITFLLCDDSVAGTVGFCNVTVEKTIPTNGEDPLVVGDRGGKVILALFNGTVVTLPRWMAAARNVIVELQRQRAGKRKYSRAYKHLNRQIVTRHRKVTKRCDNWARESADDLVADYDVAVLEDLNLVAMSKSARDTVEAAGANVSSNAGLNRSPKDASLRR